MSARRIGTHQLRSSIVHLCYLFKDPVAKTSFFGVLQLLKRSPHGFPSCSSDPASFPSPNPPNPETGHLVPRQGLTQGNSKEATDFDDMDQKLGLRVMKRLVLSGHGQHGRCWQGRRHWKPLWAWLEDRSVTWYRKSLQKW